MGKAVIISENGGPEVMQLINRQLPAPAPGQVRVTNQAIGLNFIDTYHRSGLYPLPLPTGLGLEGAGIITSVGERVSLQPGDRVAYCSAGIGAYASELNLPAERLISIPDNVTVEQAAAVLLKGQTVEYLLQRTYPLGSGETCLFHAAAGGVGLIFGQWAASLGATVIGTVGSDEKAELAAAHGYHHVINYRTDNVVDRVMEITDGKKLPVVFDGVGLDTFQSSLDCLQPRGLMVSFGNASGVPAPLDLQQLSARGSLFITRPTLLSYTADASELQHSSDCVFEQVLAASIKVEITQRYALDEVRQAHTDLEARRTTGSTLLLP